jgi:hypothetical protein
MRSEPRSYYKLQPKYELLAEGAIEKFSSRKALLERVNELLKYGVEASVIPLKYIPRGSK